MTHKSKTHREVWDLRLYVAGQNPKSIQAQAELLRRAEGLRASNEELARFNQVMVGRELRMIELKQEINALCVQLGQPPRYQPEPHHDPEPPLT